MRNSVGIIHPASSGPSQAGRGRVRAAIIRLWRSPYFSVIQTFLGILLLWEISTKYWNVPQYLVPPPIDVFAALRENWMLICLEAVATVREILGGFVLAVVTAIPTALLIVYSPTFERNFSPLVVISQAIPKVAVAPLFLVWFGFGEFPKILIAAVIAYFPMLISASVGLKSVDPDLLSLARSMGASSFRTFWKVRLPCALPNFFAGFKVAITFAVIGAVVGEFVGGDHGLGYMIQMASGLQRLDIMFAALIVLSLIAIALYYIVEMLERRFVSWHHSNIEATL